VACWQVKKNLTRKQAAMFNSKKVDGETRQKITVKVFSLNVNKK
jgi:hypothetical protein